MPKVEQTNPEVRRSERISNTERMQGNRSLRNSPWDGYKPGMFANSKAKFWVEDGKKSRWVEGEMHEYISAEDRNRNSCVCNNAICSCLKRFKGMYKITYTDHGEDVEDYCSDFDDTVVPHKKIYKRVDSTNKLDINKDSTVDE